MNSFKVLALVCLVVAKARSSPVPQPQLQPQPDNDLFAGFLRNAQLAAPFKDSPIVKRRIFEDIPDKELKQISFSGLIGDLEQSLFASALSANKATNDKEAVVEEIKPYDDQEHNINKRQLGDLSKTQAVPAVTPEPTLLDKQKVLLQTTQKVPETSGVPAHIIIDRIAIQPHNSDVALIPTFEIKRTRGDEHTKDHEITKITISKTEFSSVPNTAAPATSTTTEEAVEASTTPKNIEQLKEAETDLKEKVAEIEADPVILTARV